MDRPARTYIHQLCADTRSRGPTTSDRRYGYMARDSGKNYGPSSCLDNDDNDSNIEFRIGSFLCHLKTRNILLMHSEYMIE